MNEREYQEIQVEAIEESGMTITDFLTSTRGARVECDNRWLAWDDHAKEWVVYEHAYRSRTKVLERTRLEYVAVQCLKGEEKEEAPMTKSTTLAALAALPKRKRCRIVYEALAASYDDDTQVLIAPLLLLGIEILDAVEIIAKIGWELLENS